MRQQEEDRLRRAGVVKCSDGSLRPVQVALEREPELADYVQAIRDRIDARRAATATAQEKADADKAALAAEEKLKADRERARLGGNFQEPEPVNVFDEMLRRAEGRRTPV
jgi:hypothetical protein